MSPPRRGPEDREPAWRVLVVVPARDEGATLGRCLDSLRAAVVRLGEVRPDVHVDTMVVLDSCRDRSVDVLSSYPEVGHLEVGVRAVGAARYAGTARVRRCLAPAVRQQWHAAHRARHGHPHVHGANLGVRLDRYDAAGGFAGHLAALQAAAVTSPEVSRATG